MRVAHRADDHVFGDRLAHVVSFLTLVAGHMAPRVVFGGGATTRAGCF